MDGKLGHWSFMIGIALAVLAGLMPQLQTVQVMWLLVVLGIVVGLLNITAKETQEFLVATVALIIAASSGQVLVQVNTVVSVMLANIIAFVFPAALIVALKAIWALAQD